MPSEPNAAATGAPHPTTSHQAPYEPHDRTAELLALRTRIDDTRRELNARLDLLTTAIDHLLPGLNAVETTAPAPSPPSSPGPTLRPGDEVFVPQLGGTYLVVEVSANGQTFKVHVNGKRVEVRRDDAWALDDAPVPARTGAPESDASHASRKRPEFDPRILEIDLHGYSEDDALVTLELFLHHAFVRRAPRVRVIHGKGDGILRAAVRRELARNPLVRAIDTGPHFHGEDGVTLAELDV